MSKVTEKQATAVLNIVAAWIGKKGYGTPICPEGKALSGPVGMQHEDGTWCDNCTFGPAPTGPEAAYNGTGPTLNMAWEGWSGGAAPTILLEGGPEEWAIACSYAVQKQLDAEGIKVYVEPYASYALSIYPN